MKKSYGLTFVLLSLISVGVFAGNLQPAALTIDTVARTAMGDMVTSRFSDNDVEFIGCGSRTFQNPDGSVFVFGFCQARNADEENAFCNTDNPGMIDAIGRLADFSFVTFNWDEDGICTRIGSSTQSFYIPEFQDGMPGVGRGR